MELKDLDRSEKWAIGLFGLFTVMWTVALVYFRTMGG